MGEIFHNWLFWVGCLVVLVIGYIIVASVNAPQKVVPKHLLIPAVQAGIKAPHAVKSSITQCQSYGTGCAAAELGLFNQARSAIGVPPLTMDWTQRYGNQGCGFGTSGHVKAMVQSGGIWHINPSFPQQSFPNDICESYRTIGENVAASGRYGTGSNSQKWSDIQDGFNLYMSEQHDPAYCATLEAEGSTNHACGILNRNFTRVGIAFGLGNFSGYTMWAQTNDFLGG